MKKKWKPCKDDTYYFISLEPIMDNKNKQYTCNIKNGNYFKTKKLAKRAMSKLKKMLKKSRKF